jgi:hypothetical protein
LKYNKSDDKITISIIELVRVLSNSYKIYMKKFYIKIFICLFVLQSTSCAFFKKDVVIPNFSSKDWKKDLLGKNGYRSKILKEIILSEKLKGHKSTEIRKILGKPDFYCSNKNGFTYQYNYEYGRYRGQDKYNYKPEADCGLNRNLGSILCLEFNTNSILEDVIFVVKG